MDEQSNSHHNVDSCPSQIDIGDVPLPSQFLEDTDDIEPMPTPFLGCADNIGYVDMTPEASRDLYGEGAVGLTTQPSASTYQMSRAEAKMEEDIQLAEAIISACESSDSGEEEEGTEWSESYQWVVCNLIGDYFQKNPYAEESEMISAIYHKLNIPDMTENNFRDRIAWMIKTYLGLRHRIRDAEQDKNKKGELILECPYFYHMHKALSYSEVYKRVNRWMNWTLS